MAGAGSQSPIKDPGLATAYRGLALIGWNGLLALAVVNLLAWLLLAFGLFAPLPPGALRYGRERLAAVYPQHDDREIEELLTESWTREYVYAPFVQHKEAPMRGRWVNVAAAGFRHSAEQGPWPPAPEVTAVFVYGGSTTFGYGVGDAETIASRLQESLNASGCDRPVRVYNFGRGNYYSEQERVLFGIHLVAGHVPAAAVFIDGLNEWRDEPRFTSRLEYLIREPPSGLWRRALRTLPLIKLLQLLRDRLAVSAADPRREDAAAYGAAVIDRWLASRRMTTATGAAFGVPTLFVWQPVPTYDFDLEHHPFQVEAATAFVGHGPLRHGYARLDSLRAEGADFLPEDQFLWLADLQVGRLDPLYIDAVHYAAAFSRDIAERIAQRLASRVGCGTASASVAARME